MLRKVESRRAVFRAPLGRAALGVLALLAGLLYPRDGSSGERRTVSSRDALALFSEPPALYSTAPLWVWNDRISEDQIRVALRELASQRVLQAFVHPRPGLMTPYLSDEWFRLWRAALEEAEKLGMYLWIYDENSYPSGFAGGFVPEAMPEARGRGLVFEEAAGKPGSVAWRIVEAAPSPWYGGKYYVDLLRPGVTEKFLEITLGAYKREIGSAFGKRVLGIFTDEPHILPAGNLPWTDSLPEAFEKRWGYSLLDHLPSLVRPLGDWRRVRHDFYRLLLELFIERWAKPYYEACEREKLEFTGHYWEHEWPRCLLVPDNMALYAWHQRPAIDILMNQYDEGPHAQFGNVRSVRELSSVANQLGRRRTLCEAYGAAGWELRFVDMKRIADWLFALGVNTIDEHLSFLTIRGARKRDHPQSFSYHEPWWEEYHVRATYAARLSAALSQGDQVNQFLVIEPTTTAWFYQADPSCAERLEELGAGFQKLLLALEAAQIEYDLGCEDLIARHGSVLVRRLKIGNRAYRAVVIPPQAENLSARTMELLEELSATGGTVYFAGDPPRFVDGRPVPEDPDGKPRIPYGWERVEVEKLPQVLSSLSTDGFSIRRSPDDKGILFHHRRRFSDGELVFLANTSDRWPSSGAIRSPAPGAERWDLETGKAVPIAFRSASGFLEVPFELPPCGSLLVFLSWEPREPAPERKLEARALEALRPPLVRRLDPNVLVLDYADVTAGGETLKGVRVYRAARFAFEKHGMPGNPWESAVQFRDEFISKSFPPESGFQVTYRFRIEEKVPEEIFVVVERPDIYRIRLNGVELSWDRESWWLDRSFGKIPARSAVRVGENALELEASPFTIWHEIEAAYVIGEFGVRPSESGFAIVPEKKLEVGPWNEQLLPLYGGKVSYALDFEIPKSQDAAYRVRLPSWNGSVARVFANGKFAGHIEAPPYERDVSAFLQDGRNRIEVVVVGTLKNTLGPHHAGAGLGSAWPGMFLQGPPQGPPPGREYATVPYGLFEPFALEEVR